MRLAIFDIDGTLVTGLSTEKRFFLRLLRTGNQGPLQLLSYLYFTIRWGPRYRSELLRKNKAYLTRLSVSKLRRLADDWAATSLEQHWFRPAVERLSRHLADGDAVVLLSGTPAFVADAIARRLGVERAIGSRCAARSGRFRLRPPELHPYGGVKAQLALELCREAGLSMDDVVAYADSSSDIALLERVGQAVAVRPEAGLASVAAERGWEILGERRGRRPEIGRTIHHS